MAEDFSPLIEGEFIIDPGDTVADDELLYRQIPAHLWDAKKALPGVGAFGPLDADRGAQSFSRSSIVTAAQSFEWHNGNAPSTSLSVWACSVAEVAKAGTRAIDDRDAPLEAGKKRAPGHAYIDYRHLEKSEKKQVRAHLLMCALDREQRHP